MGQGLRNPQRKGWLVWTAAEESSTEIERPTRGGTKTRGAGCMEAFGIWCSWSRAQVRVEGPREG